MRQEQLADILSRGDVAACLAFCATLSEAERREHSRQVLAWLKQDSAAGPKPLSPAAAAAVHATCSLAQLKKLGWQALPQAEHTFEVMAARRPEWLDDWAEWLLELQAHNWPLVRRLIRVGLCRRPRTERYVLGLIVGLCPFYEQRTIYEALLDDPELLQEDIWRLFEVEGDKDLTLAARDKFARGDNNWTYAFLRLAREGRLERGRLLDATLETLARDWSQVHVGWFSQLHEALEPTLEERGRRCARYLALLASRIPPTVSFALKALDLLAKQGQLEPAAFLAAVGPALWQRHKGTVRLALQLAERVTRGQPKLGVQLCQVASAALAHESPDVQKCALDLLEKHAQALTPDLREGLQARLDDVAPSQRARLQALFPADPPAPTRTSAATGDRREQELRERAEAVPRKWRRCAGVDEALAALQRNGDLAAIEFDAFDIPHLDESKALRPIDSLEELIDVFAHALEDPSDPMELERVLDGVSRLCDQRPDDFATHTGPLRRRALQRQASLPGGPFLGLDPGMDLCGLARAWLSGEVVLPHLLPKQRFGDHVLEHTFNTGKRLASFAVPRQACVLTFLSQRVLAVARRSAAQQAAPLLAAPTHAGGWIDPCVLVERAAALETDADPLDQIQALLRLAPERRGPALKAARKMPGEFGQALRYALGGAEKIGPTPPLWVAAARARAPFADDAALERRHPDLGPNAGRAARYQASVRKVTQSGYSHIALEVLCEPARPVATPVELVTVVLNPYRAGNALVVDSHQSTPHLRWALSVWPANREAWFAIAAPPFASNLDWWEAEWGQRTYLEPLLDPDVPLGSLAVLCLALGLAAKEPGEHVLAVDALVAAIDDGRLDAARLGQALALLLPTGLVKPPRWAKTLGQAARVSPLHLHVISEAVQQSLRGPADAPRDLHALLALLQELLTELGAGVSDEQARAYLEQLNGGGRTARLVRELLALSEQPARSTRREGLLRALEQRLRRAETWSRRALPVPATASML
jgi:hypothetical protein